MATAESRRAGKLTLLETNFSVHAAWEVAGILSYLRPRSQQMDLMHSKVEDAEDLLQTGPWPQGRPGGQPN